MSTPDLDNTQTDSDQFNFLDEEAANTPARKKKGRVRKELVMPIIRKPVPISESGPARVGVIPEVGAVEDDFDFLSDTPTSAKNNSSRLDSDWNEGIHDEQPEKERSIAGSLLYVLLGVVALGVLAAAYNVFFAAAPGDQVADVPALDSDAAGVAVSASTSDSTTLSANEAAGGTAIKPLSQRFFEQLRVIEAMVAANDLDAAEQAIATMDRSVLGYGAPEFADIELQIADLRAGTNNQDGETIAEATGKAEEARAEQLATDERTAQAAINAEAARLIAEAERAVAAERTAEAAQLAEAEQAAEAARLAEAEQVAEAARLAEVEQAAEAARLAEVEQAAEAVRLAEAAQAAEAVRLVEAERAAEAARLAEAVQTAQAEDAQRKLDADAALAEQQRATAEAARVAQAAAATLAAQEAAAALAARAAATTLAAQETAAAESLALAEAKAAQRLERNRLATLETDRRIAERARLSEERAKAAEFARQQAQAREVERQQAAAEAQAQLQIAPKQQNYSITDNDFNFIGGKFVELKSAIENRDIATIVALTQRSGTRVQQMLQIFENNAAVKARIVNVASRNAEGIIVGQLRIQKLVKSNGAEVDAPSNLSSITLTSKRGPAGWSTIAW